MSFFKQLFKNKPTKVWAITTLSTFLVILIINILLVASFLTPLLNILFGGRRAIIAGGGETTYVADYETKLEAAEAGRELSKLIVEEGIVMLKNDDAMPFPDGAKVSVFGKNSVNLSYGGSGSGGKSHVNNQTIFDSLEEAGFSYNPTLKDFYESDSLSGSGRSSNPNIENAGVSTLLTGETPQTSYPNEVKNSYTEYHDAALVVITRIGGEGWDLPRAMQDGYGIDEEAHYLQLDIHERDLLKAVADAGFTRIVVIINSNNPIELGFLDDPTHYAYDQRINGCLWIGTPGDTGILGLGSILAGEVSPSGRLVDTYSRNFRNDPTFMNFGNNADDGDMITPVDRGNYYNLNGSISNHNYSFVDYEEGIYVGYKYFETRGFNNESWYNQNVVYPFGYGLSYATFTQELVNEPQGMAITKDDTIDFRVKVTNTSSTYSGKDVIQVYVTAPYTVGGIEKSYVTLAGFAKTNVLQPGQSQTVEISINPYDFASYDAITNESFVLEPGTYQIKIQKDAHTLIDSFDANVASPGITWKDGVNDEVKNRFDDIDDQLGTILSRSDFSGTYPAPRAASEIILDAATKTALDSRASGNPISIPDEEYPTFGQSGELKYYDLYGKDYNDPLWDDLLDQLTTDEMIRFITDGQFKTLDIPSIKLPETIQADGPFGFVNFMGINDPYDFADCAYYPSEVVLASTWNVELAEDFGVAIGNEALIGNERGDGIPYSGWYAPGVNIHRSPFGGRVGEYYSEDAFITGKIAANQTKGASSKGLIVIVKHLAVNEQETDRNGVATWLTEQALREIYLKPFEMTFKEGGTHAAMSSFNRIGTKWGGGDYRLLTEVLRDEWGFQGFIISDFNNNNEYANAEQMVYAGGDLHLFTVNSKWWDPDTSDATDMTVLRLATKNILFAVANSNITNADVVGYRLPVWQELMIGIDIAIFVIFMGWGALAIYKMKKKQKGLQV
ncbi:MAG: glycoside hydrolase family 3 N-terminal domain-containing protein [Acholeplasmataceae bacterium]|jgi:beta-glucosidase|nr:glycoside hydrolase family 3 N-terminal domain-containing protein [Acholeplasmataceae bacterium]